MEVPQPACGDRVEHGLKLLPRDAFAQPANDAPRRVPLRLPAPGQFFAWKEVRNPVLAVSRFERNMMVGRHDADDCVSCAVQLDGVADQVRGTAKVLLPQLVAEDNDVASFAPSSGKKPRPASGRIPNNSKKFGATFAPRSFTVFSAI